MELYVHLLNLLKAELYYSVFTEMDTGIALSDVERPLRAPRRVLRAPLDFLSVR